VARVIVNKKIRILFVLSKSLLAGIGCGVAIGGLIILPVGVIIGAGSSSDSFSAVIEKVSSIPFLVTVLAILGLLIPIMVGIWAGVFIFRSSIHSMEFKRAIIEAKQQALEAKRKANLQKTMKIMEREKRVLEAKRKANLQKTMEAEQKVMAKRKALELARSNRLLGYKPYKPSWKELGESIWVPLQYAGGIGLFIGLLWLLSQGGSSDGEPRDRYQVAPEQYIEQMDNY